MAIQTINTDIAAEVNITARRNDSFVYKFSVTNPLDTTAGLVMNSGQTNAPTYPVYQAKMSIVDASTGDVKLNLYTSFFQNTIGGIVHKVGGTSGTEPKATPPTATTIGNYSGFGHTAAAVLTGGAIDFYDSTAALGSLAVIKVPFSYMVFEPGDYIYDFQIRTQVNGDDINTIEYTTWMFGKFTLNPDITSV